MKISLYLLTTILPAFCFSQNDNTTEIPIGMKNGKVYYEQTHEAGANYNRQILYEKALQWFRTSFPDAKPASLLADQQNGTISGAGMFKVVVSDSGNYYWIRPRFTITVADHRYMVQATEFYEKPVEKGISNEYSKIEYRWRDFRKGKPWSSEDRLLFEGLHRQTLLLMDSLERSLSINDSNK